ncbi:ATP-binding protein [Rhodococcoides fascians]|uniref:ATP-binding protein n=1 Tax=Rhodococcoides fascians TaxID=1828 RepID=UPI000561D286|nr:MULTISPECIES: BTAD domain-containing putative transcriptional regulator [Rhodococcus]OZE98231.1 AfsR/SARP family transcriptional regulator [Rhodococcus sp. 15-1189-1-1a]OZF13210.1 AfsR/SARP family transcriptional regulator [Rhodococcus sp. 14-2686-1-2]
MHTEPVDQRAADIRPTPRPDVEVGLLGAVVTRVDGALVPVPGARARALLVALALEPGRRRSVAALVEDVWPGEPPRSPKNALHTQISRLRSLLPAGALDMGPSGYALVLGLDSVDLTQATSLLSVARRHVERGDHTEALASVADARELWRGEPGADLGDLPLVDDLRRRSDALAVDLTSVEIAAHVGRGDHRAALPLLTASHENDPLDEGVAAELMRCLRALDRTNEALAVFARVRRLLVDTLGADPSPALVELNAELLQAPVPRPPATVGLRASPNALIGRGADIDAIEATMREARVTTIVGPGGAGKTRIAHELGRRAAASMPVAFVELASLRRGEDVASAITGTLGLSESDLKMTGFPITRVQTAGERLRDALSVTPGLLVLDNCEHVIDDVAQVVDELVAASEYVTVLATSRSPLAITAEATYQLPALETDGNDSAATQLFVARARAVRPGVTFDRGDVASLCRSLDGLPLAIELAAARVRTMSVADIGDGLTHRFSLLRSSDRTRPERHRTLRAVIDWSWDLLLPAHRAVLSRLCRFPAGFTADAAARVAGFGEIDVADAVDGLVGQSLLTVEDREGRVRYHMLETVREFGEEHLSDTDSALVTDRLIEWGVHVAGVAEVDFRASRQIVAAASIEAEHDNIVDVLRISLQEKRWAAAYSVFAILACSWSMRGAHTEVLNWAPRMAEAPFDGDGVRDVDDNSIVLAHLVLLAHVGYNADVRASARMRVRLRRIIASRNGIDTSLRFVATTLLGRADGRGLARMLAHGTRSADPAVRNAAFMIRASLHENYGHLHEAASDAEEAKLLAAERGDMWSVASSAQTLGSIHGQAGAADDAIENYTLAADLLWDMHAYDESVQTRGFAGASMIAAGRVDEGRAVLLSITALGSGSGSALSADAEYADQRAVSLGATRAEADLAEGKIVSGLLLYRRAIDSARFEEERRGDPYITMLASASVAAHALHGATAEIDSQAADLAAAASLRLGPVGFQDLPQLGAVACALGSYLVQSGRDAGGGVSLIALSRKLRARQDYPSMRIDRHLDAARATLGADVVDAELTRTESTSRAGALAEVCELLRL